MISVAALDTENKLLGLFWSFVKTTDIAPGAGARFEITTVPFTEPPARFEYQVTGRVP